MRKRNDVFHFYNALHFTDCEVVFFFLFLFPWVPFTDKDMGDQRHCKSSKIKIIQGHWRSVLTTPVIWDKLCSLFHHQATGHPHWFLADGASQECTGFITTK